MIFVFRRLVSGVLVLIPLRSLKRTVYGARNGKELLTAFSKKHFASLYYLRKKTACHMHNG